MTIRRTRGLVGRGVVEGEPKSKRSRRTLPLTGLPEVVALLRATRVAQAERRLALGASYSAEGYVVADLLGRPLNPGSYSQRFGPLCVEAGVPVIRLHDVRHSSVTLMLAAGLPVHVVAAWHGHDPVMALRVYSHVQTDWLASAGAALAL